MRGTAVAAIAASASCAITLAATHRTTSPAFARAAAQSAQACIPTDTGGGVTQCAQPTMADTALYNCLRSYSDDQRSEDFAHSLARCIYTHS